MFDFLKKKVSGKKDYIVGLILKESEGAVLLLKVVNGTVSLIDESTFSYTNAWENLTQDIDEELFKLEKKHDVKLSKTILFLYYHLVDVDSSQIKRDYLSRLKRIMKENELEVLGFIEHHEALAQYIKHQEQSPLTAVVIEIDKPALSVLIYKGGELIFSSQVARTEEITADIGKAFSKLVDDTILPARLILYNSSTLEDEATRIMTHKWSDKLFIQLPKVDVYTRDKLSTALIYTFQNQLAEGHKQANIVQGEGEEKKEESHEDSKYKSDDKSSVSGFVIGKDIREDVQLSEDQKSPEITPQDSDASQDGDNDAFDTTEQTATPSSLKGGITGLLTRVKHLFARLKLPVVKSRAGVFSIVGLVIIISAVGVLLFNFHTAEITLFYEVDKLEEKVNVDDKLDIKPIEKSLTETATVETTGTQSVGESAKGKITIYNADTAKKSFKAGAKLVTKDGDVFLLDEDVAVASASQQLTQEGNLLTITGKTKSSATASEIGPEFNTAKDTKFTIDDFSENLYYAIAESAFTGGTKKQIQTVSEDDLKEVRKIIAKQISKKSGQELKLEKGKKVIEDLTDISIEKESFSAEVGEEAVQLKATTTASVTYYTYADTQMKQIIIKALEGEVSDDFSIVEKGVSYKIREAEFDGDEQFIEVKTVVTPSLALNTKEVINSIRGKPVSQIESIIRKKYDIGGYEFIATYDVPVLNAFVPLFEKNITVKTKAL
ncbi:MAG: hypothetical protein ACE5DQ_01900 [Candidatus Paceibacterota bacterium]